MSCLFIDHQAAALNAIFAVIQVLLGLGLACRLTVKLALAASERTVVPAPGPRLPPFLHFMICAESAHPNGPKRRGTKIIR